MTPYEKIGVGYSTTRGEDPRLQAAISAALGDAQSVVNVGAGTGSYEPRDRLVVAVEPSVRMIRQRAPGSAPVLQGVAEAIPLRSQSVDAALGVLTLHHWIDQARACRELRRVARKRVVFLTFDETEEGWWLTRDYFPQFVAEDQARMPSTAEIAVLVGGQAVVEPLLVPADCQDGFLGAFWKRPAAYLDPAVRAGISSFAGAAPESLEAGLARLEADLASGRWQDLYGEAQESLSAIDVGYRLLVCSF